MARQKSLVSTAALIAFVAFLAPFIPGCGGFGGGGGGGVARGRVVLPPGFSGSLANYAVVAAGERQPISANGSFQLHIPTQGETLVTLQDASGKIAMMGFADTASSGSAEAGGNGVISAGTTATALLFYGISGFILPPDSWSDIRAYIAASPQHDQLATVIADRLAADPSALSDNDAQINAAVHAGASALAAGHLGPRRPAMTMLEKAPNVTTTVEVVRKVGARDNGTANLILVQPSGEQGGVEVLNNPTGDGIVFVNHLRRRCATFIYETARQAPGGQLTTIDPVVQPFTQPSLTTTLGNALAMGFGPGDMLDIQPSNALHGHVGSIIDAIFGSSAFTANQTGPVLLKQDGNSIRTDYTIVVVGPSFDDSLTQFTTLSGFPAIRQEWQNAITVLNWEEGVLDILVPVISSVPLSPKFKPLGTDPGPILDIINAASNIPDLMTQLLAGRFKDATNSVLQNTVDAGTVRQAILQALWTSTFGAGNFRERFAIAGEELESFFTGTSVLDFILQLVDSSVVVADSSSENAGSAWTGSVLPARVLLTPNPATVNSVQNIAILTAQIQGVTDLSQFRFKWSTSGIQGSLEEPNSSIPMPPGPTTFNQAAYVADLLRLRAGRSDTVTVTVYDVNDINSPIGTATARVVAQQGEESGTYTLDDTDDFIGLVPNDPWVKSAVATVPLISGATQYTVELKDSLGNDQVVFRIDASGQIPAVFDSSNRPYDHVLITGGVVKIAAFGVDAVNAAVNGSDQIVMNHYHVATVDVFYQ